MKIKDPYSTETECEDNEHMDECDYKPKESDDIPVITVRLTPTPDLPKISVIEHQVEVSRAECSEMSSDSSDSSYQSVRQNNKDEESVELLIRELTDGISKDNPLLGTNCSEENSDSSGKVASDAFRDTHFSILSDFERNERNGSQRIDGSQDRHNYLPFPKEDNDLQLKRRDVEANASNASKEVCLRDSGFSDASKPSGLALRQPQANRCPEQNGEPT